MALTSTEIRLCQESPEFKLATVANCERAGNRWAEAAALAARTGDDRRAALRGQWAAEAFADAHYAAGL